MIQDNIKVMADYDATEGAVKANDTLRIQDGKSISSILIGSHVAKSDNSNLPH